jgi:putative CocE/NonD family hydrolase
LRSSFALWFAALAVAAVHLAAPAPAGSQAEEAAEKADFPLNVFQDEAEFTFYLNEEVLVTGSSTWLEDGSFSSEYRLSMAGQYVDTKLAIEVDEDGYWTRMHMETARGPVTVTRQGTKAVIDDGRGTDDSVELLPNTILFENFSPSLMTQMVMAYDQEAGGKQVFPLFIIPAVVMEGSLERLEEVEKAIGGEDQTFTIYRYGVPGVDVILWVDEANRVCMGDVPAQSGAYVRNGYEALRLKEEDDPLLSRPEYEVHLDSNVDVPMRDGVSLKTDIYRPDAEGRFPVILVRTPYKKEMNELQAKFYARRGYVYAVQDCRGRFSSPGTWNPFFNDPEDGYDTIEWLAAQPWSTGKVGMIGASYLGWVQWWAARERPPHLAAMIPNVSPPDPYYNIPYEYGAFFLLGAIWWADVVEAEVTADLSGRAFADLMEKEYTKILRHLPVIDLDEIVLGEKNKYWREWIAHPDNDEYWAKISFLDHLEDLDVPVYHQSGWWDGDGIGSKLNYATMAGHGHKNQKLVLGPWGHTDTAVRRGPYNTDYGPNAIVSLSTSYLRWMDRWLKGLENGIDQEPLVSLFVMHTDKWLRGNTYPLEGTGPTRFYLSSGGSANTSGGDGVLSAELPGPGSAEFDAYVYDPGDPTPDIAMFDEGDEDCEPKKEEEDACEAESVEKAIADRLAYHAKVSAERQDMLVYETEAFAEDLTFAGPVSGVLYASSSARDTDWFMRLSVVDADGAVRSLTRGVIRARYRNSFSEPELLEPGTVYEYNIDMWQTGVTVPAGAKLRVEVSSASFPMFSRNLNTGGHNETETEFVSADQKVYHTEEYPSHVLLPVIPNPEFVDQGLP